MSIERCEIMVGGVPVHVVRKAIKNLHLGVYPPNGRVRIAAPLAVSDAAIRLAVVNKLGWIRRQQTQFKTQPRQSRRQMVSGETHYFLGRRYRLRVLIENGPPQITIAGRAYIELRVPKKFGTAEREEIIHRWYRQRLQRMIPPMLEKWQAKLGVQMPTWTIRKMKTKWGSCNPDARHILLNLELAKKPVQCLEYILVHELAHLHERRHNDRFTAILDKHLPTWKSARTQLNSEPLAHAVWTY